MSSSKLAYLSSKYTSTDGDKKKKKKKHKKEKRRRQDFIVEHDQDAAADNLLLPPVNDEQDEEEDEEGPTVVKLEGSIAIPQQQDKDEGVRRRGLDSDQVPQRKQQRRRRHDSDDDNEAPPRKRRHDSDSENEGHRVERKTASSKPRRRYDSDDDDEAERNKPRRRRHDSSDEESKRPRRRYDSDDDEKPATKPRHRRHDSEDYGNGGKVRRRYDSDEEPSPRSKPRRRYGSDDEPKEELKPNKRRYDSDENEQKPNIGDISREKMSSGHAAGLQQADNFSMAEQEIQKQRRKEAQAMVDRHGMGETIYRDEAGRKVDASQVKQKKSIPQLSEKEQAELNKGRVQKQQEQAHQREWQEVQESSFARYQDDAGLEDARRDVIRDGDPMAMHATKKNAKVRAVIGRPQRPVYKGPAPKPNRYGIRPGYRWDGVDRGNGFEDKVLASQYSANHKREQAYRWSSADM